MPKKPSSKDGWVKLQHARAYVQQNYPYFYRTLLGLIPEDVPGEGTLFVTNTMVLGVDMEWFGTLEVDVAAGCLIHEVMHILRGMYRIAQLPDQKRAGYAFDIPINDDLKRAKIKLPPWVVYSSTHNLPPGLTGEKYYELLKTVQLPPGLLIGSGRCGSCHTHDARKTKHSGRTPQEVHYFRKIGVQDLKEHIKNMHPGDVPGSWSELVDMKDAGPAIIPWQSIAKSSIHRAFGSIQRGQADFSLKHPSKRSCAAGFIRPGMVESAPEVVIIEDSSASMGQSQTRENRVELISAMTKLGLTTVWFISADTVARTKPMKITLKELATMPLVGRGGTDFIAPIEAALKIQPRPNFIIYSTDGGGKAPLYKPRGVEFIWLLAPGSWTVSPCNWGIQILTTNDPEERKKYTLLT